MRDSYGTTKLLAHCKVCGELSLTEIYTKNQVLVEVAILCREHKDYLLNKIEFKEMRRNGKV
tara:strand:- start:357 stop:542 length:186 start_codon:yes stop_codon:yes gene_type:complete